MPVRVLHIVTYMGRGGLETMLMNYYRHIDRSKVQFDFLVHREFEADYDAEIHELGGKIFHISRLIPWSHSYRRKLKHFFQENPEYTSGLFEFCCTPVCNGVWCAGENCT